MNVPKTIRRLLVLLLLAALAAAAILHFRKTAGSARPRFVSTPLERGAIVQTVTANGNLSAVQTVTVGSEVSGKIVALFADFNDAVTNGQLIARLDASTYERAVEQARAEIDSAQATLDLQQADFRRAEELLSLDLVSQSDYDSAKASLAQAKASLRMRQAALSKALVDLEKTEIYSPIDGVVISRAVDAGQTVAASMQTPTLFTLARDLREMRIQAEISEADVGGIATGQPVSFTVDAYPDRTFSGTISQVRLQPVTNAGVVSYTAIIDVDNADRKLLPGMTANASIVTAERDAALRVSNAALRYRPADGIPIATPSPPPETPAANAAASADADAAAAADANVPAPPADHPRQSGHGQPADGTARPAFKTLYTLADPDATALTPLPVRTGISDGTWTEILEGGPVREGTLIVTGTAAASASSASSAKPRNPAMPFGGPPAGGPPPRH